MKPLTILARMVNCALSLLGAPGELFQQLIEVGEQRDHAIATKALIRSRREVTAMATSSVAVREVARLSDAACLHDPAWPSSVLEKLVLRGAFLAVYPL